MKQSFCVTVVAVVIILIIQILYIQSLYHNYTDNKISNVEDSLYVAIDNEYHWRMRMINKKQPETQHILRYKLRSDMTSEELDSLQSIDKDSIVMDEVKLKRIGTTSSDFITQLSQDIALKKGYPMQFRVLDSIFNGMMKGKILYRLVLLDKDKTAKESSETFEGKADYVYPLFPIGIKGLQYIKLEIQIPMGEFIVNHVMVMVISMLLMLTVLGCVLYQLLVIRRKDILLKKREQTINGTIHDLKAPLNSVVTTLSWIKSGEPDETKGKVIKICQTEVKRMVYNIESLLVTVRKDRCKLILKKEPADILALVCSVKESIDILYAKKPHGVRIVNQLPDKFLIRIDRMYIENVIRNLVENSLKYSDDGVEVTIELSVSKENLRVSVKDTGWGIAPRYHKKIFKQFFQVPRKEKQICRGYGIGLAQCKYIIEEHQGTIGVESTEETGSEFWFTLPINK